MIARKMKASGCQEFIGKVQAAAQKQMPFHIRSGAIAEL